MKANTWFIMHDYYTKIFMRQKEKLKHAIIAIVILTTITPASSHPQTIPLNWQQVASGVWKVKIGVPQKFDLLTTANIHSGIEALKALVKRDFRSSKAIVMPNFKMENILAVSA